MALARMQKRKVYSSVTVEAHALYLFSKAPKVTTKRRQNHRGSVFSY
jgi:hypothetical protein